MTGNRLLIVGCIGMGQSTLTERILSTMPAVAMGPAFRLKEEPDFERHLVGLRRMERCMLWSPEPQWIENTDETPLKAVQRRFREHVQALRPPEPQWVPPGVVKPGRRAAVRWGARSREQRSR